jgi:hypothetical protein
MNQPSSQDILNKLYEVLFIVPTKYVTAISSLHQRFEGKNINWVVNGDLAEALRIVQVEPDCIEIICTKQDSEKIFQVVQDLNPSPINYQYRQLTRNAVIDGSEFPIQVRSYYFDFNLESVMVKVQGDLQFKVGDWDWGDIFLFAPEYVYVVGKKTAITPLTITAELYQYFGWTDRFEKVKVVIQKPLILKQRRPF